MQQIKLIIAIAVASIVGSSLSGRGNERQRGQVIAPATTAAAPTASASVPGAIKLRFDQSVDIKAQSQQVTLGKAMHLAVYVPDGIFAIDDNNRLTATLNVGLLSVRGAEYRIHAAVFDSKGHLLGTAAHKVESQTGIRSVLSIGAEEIALDFGSSKGFRRAEFAVVVVSDPSVPRIEDK